MKWIDYFFETSFSKINSKKYSCLNTKVWYDTATTESARECFKALQSSVDKI